MPSPPFYFGYNRPHFFAQSTKSCCRSSALRNTLRRGAKLRPRVCFAARAHDHMEACQGERSCRQVYSAKKWDKAKSVSHGKRPDIRRDDSTSLPNCKVGNSSIHCIPSLQVRSRSRHQSPASQHVANLQGHELRSHRS